ncbi:glycosyltransferase family 62 protein [Myriangium duriaei CBS 260.36]|uniref:Glycosyltransferase family 62 protein n=1 Tax=Myriangium duriaei CBS 260.36 TaxID=1168546 RepID=A0A9P4IV45_9PEZI|nr:glycosyltransferase family 62 protein [Myriangium duriaei CBS 260.36]
MGVLSPKKGYNRGVVSRRRILTVKNIYQALFVACVYIIFRLATHRTSSTVDSPIGTFPAGDPDIDELTNIDESTEIDESTDVDGLTNQDGFMEAEVELGANLTRYTRIHSGLQPDLLWLTLTYDDKSRGRLPDEARRNISHIHELIAAQYKPERISLGLMTSSMDEYEFYKESVQDSDYAKVTIFRHPGFRAGPFVDRAQGHDNKVQKDRRAEMAKLRNYLMLKTLEEEEHIVWLDADVFHIDTGLVDRMIQHTQEQDKYGILTSLCQSGDEGNYDRNAWDGTRKGPRSWDLNGDELKAGELKKQGQSLVHELLPGTGDDDLVPLTAIGATILYLRGDLVTQGLNFPHQYTVGTRWMKDGWDGIESEGLCYRGRGLKGGGCAVMGGKWKVRHTA